MLFWNNKQCDHQLGTRKQDDNQLTDIAADVFVDRHVL